MTLIMCIRIDWSVGGVVVFTPPRSASLTDHGGASSQGRLCTAVEVIHCIRPHEGQLHVCVGVDAT